MTSRFNQRDNNSNEGGPLLKFPFLSVLASGKHTELILTRGIGLHTIVGITHDIAIGNCMDTFAKAIQDKLKM